MVDDARAILIPVSEPPVGGRDRRDALVGLETSVGQQIVVNDGDLRRESPVDEGGRSQRQEIALGAVAQRREAEPSFRDVRRQLNVECFGLAALGVDQHVA